MRVGVTGASGLIGRSLIGALRERGDTPVVFVRPSSVGFVADTVRWDPARGAVDETDLERVGRLDAIVNLAGAGIGDRRWSPARKKVLLDSRVLATTLVVNVVKERLDDEVFLANASAVGWYGSRGDESLDEASSRGAGFLSDVCVAWEHATSPLEALGVSVAHVRSGTVLSSTGGALKKQLPLFRAGLGGRFASGDQWMSVISLFDEVRALLWTIDHRLTGPVNLVAPSPLTNRAFSRELASVLGRTSFVTAPKPLLQVVLGREMAEELILVSQRVAPQRLRESNFKFEHADARAALEWALTAQR